jgi:hypothetical protein
MLCIDFENGWGKKCGWFRPRPARRDVALAAKLPKQKACVLAETAEQLVA